MEEEYINWLCKDIIHMKPNAPITEKGKSDLAQHYLLWANITTIHRVQKTDHIHIARACGTQIVI